MADGLRWRPVLAGLGVTVATTVAGVSVPLPESVVWAGPLALVAVGALGGAVAGTMADGGWRARRRNGLAVGAVAGVAVAAVLIGAMRGWLTAPRHTAVWELTYWVAVGAGRALPADVVARYDPAIAAGIGVVVGLLVAAGSVFAAVAVPGRRGPGIDAP